MPDLFPASPFSSSTELFMGLKNRSNKVFSDHLGIVTDLLKFLWANPHGLTPQQAFSMMHGCAQLIGMTGEQTYGRLQASATYLNTVLPGSIDASVPANVTLMFTNGAPTITPVPQVATSIVVTPQHAEISVGALQQFAATVSDQFGTPMATQPAITWTADIGTIDPAGNYTAPQDAGSATVTATTGSLSATAAVTIS